MEDCSGDEFAMSQGSGGTTAGRCMANAGGSAGSTERKRAPRRLQLRRRRRSRHGTSHLPLRLGWPAGGTRTVTGVEKNDNVIVIDDDDDDDGNNSDEENSNRGNGDKAKEPPKRNAFWRSSLSSPAPVAACGRGTGTSVTEKLTRPSKRRLETIGPPPPPSCQLWAHKHAPADSSELCVAPKKVKEVRRWMEEALIHHNVGEGRRKLLVLVGSPGIGKSTTVRCLAREMDVNLSEWTESFSCRIPSNGTGCYHYDGGDSALSNVDQSAPLAQFEEFLNQAAAGYDALTLTSSSTAATQPSQQPKSKKRRSDLGIGTSSGRTVILLDDLPHRHGTEARVRFREILTRHVRETTTPTILVYSDTVEGRHRPADLEDLVDPAVLYQPSAAVQITQVHAVTAARMKKALRAVAQREGLSPPSLSQDKIDEIHATSGGDIRQALATLQFQMGAPSAAAAVLHGKKHPHSKASQQKGHHRDQKLSTFHALGKLLYAKRRADDVPAVGENDRPPLEFDPERVVESSDMEMGGTLAFLGYHCPDFFSDCSELSRAMDAYSDAAFLLERRRGTRSNSVAVGGVFPEGYAASLAGRAAADANRHPAPTRFRQFSAPTIFEVLRHGRENRSLLSQLQRRLSAGDRSPLVSGGGSGGGSLADFCTSGLPYVRAIQPQATRGTLDRMHSHARHRPTASCSDVVAADREGRGGDNGSWTVEQWTSLVKEQEEVLRGDDIVDFDNDSDSDSDDAHKEFQVNDICK